MSDGVFIGSNDLKTCVICIHRNVCGMYDALLDATNLIDDFNETNPDYDSGFYKVLAGNCRSFMES